MQYDGAWFFPRVGAVASRTVIIDQVPLFRDGIVTALNSARNYAIVDQASAIADAARIAEIRRPDVIILGLTAIGEAASVIEAVIARVPGINIICLTPVGSEAEIPKLLRAGAKGCMARTTQAHELIRCLEVVLNGDSYVSPSLVAGVLRQPVAKPQAIRQERRASLTERESHILELVAEGQSNKDIAAKLSLSEKTVKRYMTFIMQKIHVRNRLQAAIYISNGGAAVSDD